MTRCLIVFVLFVLSAPELKSQICFGDSINCIRLKEHSFYDTVYNGRVSEVADMKLVFRRKNWLRAYNQLKKSKKNLSIKELEYELVTKYNLKDYAHVFDSVAKADPQNPDPILLDVELIFDQMNCELYQRFDTVNVVRTPERKKRYLFIYYIRGVSYFKYKVNRKKMHSLRMLAAYDRLIKDKRLGLSSLK